MGPSRTKNPVHLDLASEDAAAQRGTVARLRSLGARAADVGQRNVPWVVLADPEGNELCVLEPRPDYAGTGPVAAVVMDRRDPASVVGFWSAVTGWPVGEVTETYAWLRPPAGAPRLELLAVADARSGGRVHLAVEPARGVSVEAALAAVADAGGGPAVALDGGLGWRCEDPEGHALLVLPPA